MSGHDSKYFSTTKKGEIPELKEELIFQYKVPFPSPPSLIPLPSLRSPSRSPSVASCAFVGWFIQIQIWAGFGASRHNHRIWICGFFVGSLVGFHYV
ncbi:hypothetical protein GUJ93_ZPchr0013g35630 [Zizania palustris]|uniref:Uncharacterized protein n=1 Tax=Zizania palustris TaxID=103762 RepID=A0A8J5X347_ZIZPA|nr:hypothetical protein GUJ93_ZPchr0013g35630 [Zizania palustris]